MNKQKSKRADLYCYIITDVSQAIIRITESREMAQRLTAPTVLTEDPGLIPNTHKVPWNHL